MDLADHQRKLLGLFRSSYQVCAEDDPYIHKVSASKDLQEGKKNIFLWRIFVLERTCPLTFRLLRRRNLLGETLGAFIRQHNISPFRETQAPDFLEAMSEHTDSLIASVAQFELALLKVRAGDPGSYSVHWSVDPYGVLDSLAKDIPLDERLDPNDYQIIISGAIPDYFRITRVGVKGCTTSSKN